MVYFGLWYEYYKDGSMKAAIIPRNCNKRPKTKNKITPICAGFEYWFTTEAHALEIKGNIEKTVGCLGDMFNFYAGYVEGSKNAA